MGILTEAGGRGKGLVTKRASGALGGAGCGQEREAARGRRIRCPGLGPGVRPAGGRRAIVGKRPKVPFTVTVSQGLLSRFPAAEWPRDWFTGISHGDEDRVRSSQHFGTGFQHLQGLGGPDPHQFVRSVASSQLTQSIVSAGHGIVP